jgi:large subunit ribosomal protein L15
MFALHSLPKSTQKKSVRVGRGEGSNRGKNSGKGHKGQTKHGGKVRIGFEGGQKPLIKRIPKLRGFKRIDYKTTEVTLSLSVLDKNFKDGEQISLETLKSKNLITTKTKKVRVIKAGTITKKLSLVPGEPIHLTKGARQYISV